MITETKLCEYILKSVRNELKAPTRQELVQYTGMPASQLLSSFENSDVIKHLWELSIREISYLVEECSKHSTEARDLSDLKYVLLRALLKAEKDLSGGNDGPFVA